MICGQQVFARFVAEAGLFKLTSKNSPEKLRRELSDVEQAVLEQLLNKSGQSVAEISESADIEQSVVQRGLRRLRERDLARCVRVSYKDFKWAAV